MHSYHTKHDHYNAFVSFIKTIYEIESHGLDLTMNTNRLLAEFCQHEKNYIDQVSMKCGANENLRT